MAKSVAKSSKVIARVGQRVRARRKEQGWTIRSLAERTGLSARFLSELEAGRGNIAISRLAQVAQALDAPLEALVAAPREGRDDPAAEISALLAGRSPAALRRCLGAVQEALERRPRFVALLGLRGAGKSTLGAQVAAALGLDFVELDEQIEAAAGLSLGELFALHGEPYYRRLETERLRALVASNRPSVVALSGGVVTNPDAFGLTLRHATTLWLQADPDDHMQRVLDQGDQRPMANRQDAMAELRALLAAREPFYRQAELHVDTSAAGDQALARVLDALTEAGWSAPA